MTLSSAKFWSQKMKTLNLTTYAHLWPIIMTFNCQSWPLMANYRQLWDTFGIINCYFSTSFIRKAAEFSYLLWIKCQTENSWLRWVKDKKLFTRLNYKNLIAWWIGLIYSNIFSIVSSHFWWLSPRRTRSLSYPIATKTSTKYDCNY